MNQLGSMSSASVSTMASNPLSPTPQGSNVDDVVKQFESLFMSMMLKSMRQSMSQDMFAGDSSDTFGGMFDSFLGQHIAEHSSLGLAALFQGTTDQAPVDSGDLPADSNHDTRMEAYRNVIAAAE